MTGEHSLQFVDFIGNNSEEVKIDFHIHDSGSRLVDYITLVETYQIYFPTSFRIGFHLSL